jgi:Zn-dependent peptidase ImmA (M78 family)
MEQQALTKLSIAPPKWYEYLDHAVPLDVYADFRSIGIHVFRRKLGNSKISGLFIMHPVAGKCALVNSNEDVYRQRFSAAHETIHRLSGRGRNRQATQSHLRAK